MPIPDPETPEFQALLAQLSDADRVKLEAYIRQQFGDTGGTIGDEVRAGRMTPQEAVQMLVRSGYSPDQAETMVETGMLNIPLLTNPGEIAASFGSRGGIRALEGPYALQRSR